MPVSTDEVLKRIDEIDSFVKGIMIYIAARETGRLEDNLGEDLIMKDFVKNNPARAVKNRLFHGNPQEGVPVTGSGFSEAQAICELQRLVEELKSTARG